MQTEVGSDQAKGSAVANDAVLECQGIPYGFFHESTEGFQEEWKATDREKKELRKGMKRGGYIQYAGWIQLAAAKHLDLRASLDKR